MSKLFAEFPEVTTEQWEAAIAKDLKGADYQKKLVWKTMEGFSVRPYYRAQDLNDIKHLGTMPGQFPYVRGTKSDNSWLVRQSIMVVCPKEANKVALDILNRGVESLNFVVTGKEFSLTDLEELLKDITLPAIELNFSGKGAKTITPLFLEMISKTELTAEDVNVSFDNDPIIKTLSLKGVKCCSSYGVEEIAAIAKDYERYGRVRLITVNGQRFNDCGATIVQEAAFALSVAHEYLVRLMECGISIDKAARLIKFNLSISSNYFMEMAKFRAIRMLWANIVKQYNPTKECALKMKVNAITSAYNMTLYDPYVNMLRGTTESMSAAIAGVASIEVRPFDDAFEDASEFSMRIARNTQLLLKEESHFDQVADAAGGSYYVENLTASIAEHAWTLFKEIESEGGYIASFEKGTISTKIGESAAKKDKNIATRHEVVLGTNQYPNFTEHLNGEMKKKPCCCQCNDKESEFEPLKPYRASEPFEELRRRVDLSGKKPKAFMLTVGNLAFCRARAQFSSNFFGCAGIEPIDNTRFDSVEEGVAAAKAAKAEIVVICSSDDEYASAAFEAFEKLADSAIFVVAGDPACKEELIAKGITNFISVRSNVLESLQNYISQLGI